MAYSKAGQHVVMFGGRTVVGGTIQISNETWTWGRRVASVPANGSDIRVGSEVQCLFDPPPGVQFLGWTANGFAPPVQNELSVTFHAESPGTAAISAQWADYVIR